MVVLLVLLLHLVSSQPLIEGVQDHALQLPVVEFINQHGQPVQDGHGHGQAIKREKRSAAPCLAIPFTIYGLPVSFGSVCIPG